MIIKNNISAIFANRQANLVNQNVTKDMERLSSGMRINTSADDASGLAVSEKMRTQIRGLNQAMRNTQDTTSFIQTTEGYLQEVTNTIQRIRELAIQGANGIYTDEDRGYLNLEIGMLVEEVDRIANTAQFNTMNMLNGRFAQATSDQAVNVLPDQTIDPTQAPTQPVIIPDTDNRGLKVHIGSNQDNQVQLFIKELSSQGLGLRDVDGNITVGTTTAEMANLSIGRTDNALREVISQRTELGAYQNRFQSVYQGLYIAYENTSAAESRIRDANMAQEVSSLVKNQILQQASVSMIAQANLQPQMILTLLQ